MPHLPLTCPAYTSTTKTFRLFCLSGSDVRRYI